MEVTRESAKAGVKVVGKSSKCSVETNTIVPDRNPDILKILQVDATCNITSKTVRQGKISVEGKIFADVLYLPEGDVGIKVIPTEFEYNDVIECPGLDEGMHVLVNSEIAQADINLVNSRKIGIQVAVITDVDVIAEREIEYISSVDMTEAAYKSSDASIYSTLAHEENEFVLKEQVELPSDRKEICEILKCDSKICNKEVRASGNKVIVKGSINSNLLYCNIDNSIDCVETSFPFTEVFEVCELSGDEQIEVKAVIKNRKHSKDTNIAGEMKVINYEFLVGLELFITKEQQICYISDCYFFGAGTDIKREEIDIEQLKCHSSGVKNIREIIPCDKSLPKISSVYNVVTHPVIISTERERDSVTVNGKLETSILYLSDDTDNPLCCQKAEIPVSHRFNVSDTEGITVFGECEHMTFALTSGGDIELRGAVELKLEERKTYPVKFISDINRVQEDKNNEIIIFFANGIDSVWDIAKRYRGTPEDLASLNDLEEDAVIEKGRRIIIPGI